MTADERGKRRGIIQQKSKLRTGEGPKSILKSGEYPSI